MKDPRNPFLLRKSEVIDSDSAYLDLFEPGMLDVLPAEKWFDNVRMIRSAAGGGKTSLLRLFKPETLHQLHGRRLDIRLKELHERVVGLGALDEGGPQLLGVSVICGRNYAHLQDLDVDQARRDRVFFGLLNSRIILATLAAQASFAGIRYRDQLNQLEFADLDDSKRVPGLPLPCNGQVLKEWAAKIEDQICIALDSFGPMNDESAPGHDSLVSLWIAQPDMVRFHGRPLASRTLLMLDDIHQLSSSQRDKLIATVIELRSPVGVWIAERFEALTTEEMLASGSIKNRDHNETIEIEQYWRNFYTRFEKHCLHVANRRVQWARGTDLQSFDECIVPTLDGPEWDSRFATAADTVANRVRAIASDDTKFAEWVQEQDRKGGTARENALQWKELEILIERQRDRERRSRQKTLFDLPLSAEALENEADTNSRNAAELFLAREFGFPYYFGSERISRLASLNVEQFIGLAGDIFWEVVSGAIRQERRPLPPERQHALMVEASKAVWDDIPTRVTDGRALRNLLEGIASFSQWYTYRPSAPNDPGVSGTAIRMSEREQLLDRKFLERQPRFRRLADLLASALAHNLLVAQLDYGCKGDSWMVLNLNRILCVSFALPLHYGKYKERPLKTLAEWIDRRFVPPAKEESLL